MSSRGAPLGNHNARQHGFYSRRLDEAGSREYEAARDAQGLGHELALLRVKLHRLVRDYPDRLDLQLAALRAIARLVRVSHDTQPGDKESLGRAMARIRAEEAQSLGMKIVRVPSKRPANPPAIAPPPPDMAESDGNK